MAANCQCVERTLWVSRSYAAFFPEIHRKQTLGSSNNTAKSNTIYGSAESGIHPDDSCGGGNGNTATGNVVNEACAGILLGTGTGNTFSPNSYYNVVNTTMSGDTCISPTFGPAQGAAKASRARPSAYIPRRKQ